VDHVDPGGRGAIDRAEQLGGAFRHDHAACRLGAQRGQHGTLRVRGPTGNGVESGHDRNVQALDHVQDVGAVRAPEDAELVLDRHDVYAAGGDPVCGSAVVVAIVAAHSVPHFNGIAEGVAGAVDRDDLAGADRFDQVPGEGRDPTPARRVRGYVGNPKSHKLRTSW
jgi:hypothetical protein